MPATVATIHKGIRPELSIRFTYPKIKQVDQNMPSCAFATWFLVKEVAREQNSQHKN
jgi:hypothetical protein